MGNLQDKVNKRIQEANEDRQGSNFSYGDSQFKDASNFYKRQIDLQELGANRAGKIMFGKPIAIDAPLGYSKIAKEMKLQALMRTAEEVMFKQGNVIVVLTKNSKGKISTMIADPNFPNKVIRIGGVPYQAVIWRHVKIDRTKFYVKEIYDYKKVVRHIYTTLSQTTEVPLDKFNKSLPDGLKLLEEEEHNLGALPVVEMHRKPIWDYSRPYTASALYKLDIQSMLDETTAAMRLETENNRTKIVLDQSFVDGLSKQDQAQIAKSDILIKIDGTGKDPKSGKAVEVMQGDPKFDSYWLSINNIIRIMLEVAGYSDLQDGESNNPTATGAIFTKANDLETSNDLLKYRAEYIKELLIKAKNYKNGSVMEEQDIEDNSLIVNVFPNIIFNEMNLTNTLNTQREAGWISDSEAISRLLGISIKEADKKVVEIKPIEPTIKEDPIKGDE